MKQRITQFFLTGTTNCYKGKLNNSIQSGHQWNKNYPGRNTLHTRNRVKCMYTVSEHVRNYSKFCILYNASLRNGKPRYIYFCI